MSPTQWNALNMICAHDSAARTKEGWLIGDKFVPLVVMAILREGRFIGLSADKKLAVPTKAGRMCAFLAGHLKAYGDLPQ